MALTSVLSLSHDIGDVWLYIQERHNDPIESINER